RPPLRSAHVTPFHPSPRCSARPNGKETPMNFTPRKLLSALGLTVAGIASAQQPPTVWIPPEPSQQPIVLDEVDIRIQMQGFLATTRIEMTFANPNPRVLEGEFVFPL